MIKILENLNNNKIEKHINNINKTWAFVKTIKSEFDAAMDVICKEGVYDLNLHFDEDELDEFYSKVYDIVNGKLNDVILVYNENAEFNKNFSLLFNFKINFVKLDKFITSLITAEEIDDFDNEDINKYIIDDKINYDKFISVFKEYDDNGEQLINNLDKQLNGIFNEIHYQYSILDKIVDIYENIKNK